MSAKTENTETSGLVKWVDDRLPFVAFTKAHIIDYPTPRNLTYLWNFGSLAGIALVILIMTGILLAMQYTANTELAFGAIERIMRDVNYGWLVRYIHMNTVTFFFIVVYLHMARGLYFGSYKYPRELLWMLGVVILLLMMAAAFLGYVLPWGQMSFWGATVITNLFSAIPIVGDPIVTWLWGGFTVDNPTLTRFFALHYLIPFLIVAVVILHLAALHRFGSSNPIGIDAKGAQDKIPFHPYYTVKDLFGLGVFLTLLAFFVFFQPEYFNHAENYQPADPLSTPEHIVPEWYFLPFYAILRSVPDQLFGVILMFGSIFVLFFLPWLDRSPVRSANFRPIYRQFYWVLIVSLFVLGYVGAKPPEGIYLILGRVATAYYFLHFLVLLPLLGIYERPKPLPTSISDSVIKKGGGKPAGAPVKPMEKA